MTQDAKASFWTKPSYSTTTPHKDEEGSAAPSNGSIRNSRLLAVCAKVLLVGGGIAVLLVLLQNSPAILQANRPSLLPAKASPARATSVAQDGRLRAAAAGVRLALGSRVWGILTARPRVTAAVVSITMLLVIGAVVASVLASSHLRSSPDASSDTKTNPGDLKGGEEHDATALSPGAIAGGVIGAVVFLAVVAGVFSTVMRCRCAGPGSKNELELCDKHQYDAGDPAKLGGPYKALGTALNAGRPSDAKDLAGHHVPSGSKSLFDYRPTNCYPNDRPAAFYDRNPKYQPKVNGWVSPCFGSWNSLVVLNALIRENLWAYHETVNKLGRPKTGKWIEASITSPTASTNLRSCDFISGAYKGISDEAAILIDTTTGKVAYRHQPISTDPANPGATSGTKNSPLYVYYTVQDIDTVLEPIRYNGRLLQDLYCTLLALADDFKPDQFEAVF